MIYDLLYFIARKCNAVPHFCMCVHASVSEYVANGIQNWITHIEIDSFLLRLVGCCHIFQQTHMIFHFFSSSNNAFF